MNQFKATEAGPEPRARVPGVLALFIPSLAEGGAERVAVNVLRAVRPRRGHFLLLEPRVAYSHEGEIHTIGRGNFLHGHGRRRRLGQLGRAAMDLALAKRRLGVDACLSLTTWPNVLNVLARGPGRTVISVHNHESTAIRGRSAPLVRALVRATYPRADAIVAVSDSVADDLAARFGIPRARITTIYNALDLDGITRDRVQPLEPALDTWMDDRTIVTAGRLVEQKGQWHLVRALAELRRRGGSARLAVLGARGALAPWIVGLARDLGLRTFVAWEDAPETLHDADVAFLGFRKNPFNVMARAALFAFPSLWEGFGNVLLEAMACGAPVISSDCEAGPREILGGARGAGPAHEPEEAPYGLLLPRPEGQRLGAESPPSAVERMWADAIDGLLHDRDRLERMRQRSQIRASGFGLEASADAWRDVLFGDFASGGVT